MGDGMGRERRTAGRLRVGATGERPGRWRTEPRRREGGGLSSECRCGRCHASGTLDKPGSWVWGQPTSRNTHTQYPWHVSTSCWVEVRDCWLLPSPLLQLHLLLTVRFKWVLAGQAIEMNSVPCVSLWKSRHGGRFRGELGQGRNRCFYFKICDRSQFEHSFELERILTWDFTIWWVKYRGFLN